jgi:hypothetical protein
VISLMNYADHRYSHSQRLNSLSGLHVGKFDRLVSFGPRDIDGEFRQRHERILRLSRGGGLWLWKPYFILRRLNEMADGDLLFYCDAGACFIRRVAPLADLLERVRQDVLPFELDHPERVWSKRDALVLMQCDQPQFAEARQRLGGFSLWRASPRSRALAEELLSLARDERLLTDTPNTCGLPNYPGFVEHRHDQSLFSLLTKKHGLKAYRDPSQWGNRARGRHPESTYDQLIWLTRFRF